MFCVWFYRSALLEQILDVQCVQELVGIVTHCNAMKIGTEIYFLIIVLTVIKVTCQLLHSEDIWFHTLGKRNLSVVIVEKNTVINVICWSIRKHFIPIYPSVIISPNEVFGDIMVLASRPPPPIDPDDVNALTLNLFNGSLSNFIWG